MWAVGPPKEVRPSRSAAANTSAAEPERDGGTFSLDPPFAVVAARPPEPSGRVLRLQVGCDARRDAVAAGSGDGDGGGLEGGADAERRGLARGDRRLRVRAAE